MMCPALNGLKAGCDISGADCAGDDVTGAQLDAAKIKNAREDERELIRNMRVYYKVPRSWAWSGGGRVIGVRWIDQNKGDSMDSKN